MNNIYLDYASTTPTDPQVVEAMEPYFFRKFGNASSPHTAGREAGRALEESRQTLASFLGARPEEIVFTSGATESNNHAIYGVARASRGKHIIVSSIEHHSVLEPVNALRKAGYRVTSIPVDPQGGIDPQLVRQAINQETCLIALMHASNEIGTIQPAASIGSMAREHKIPFLVDAVQTVGHLPVQVDDLKADLLSLSAHKFYGPKGIGALYVRQGLKLDSLLLGGDQEKSRRASTQNVAGAVGMARAIELCRENMANEERTQSQWRDKIIHYVLNRIEGARLNGHPKQRLPNNAHFSFEKVEGESLLMGLDMQGICCSMGSACTSGAMEPSHVLRAIGLSDELAFGALRVTLGRFTAEDEIDLFLDRLPVIIDSLRI